MLSWDEECNKKTENKLKNKWSLCKIPERCILIPLPHTFSITAQDMEVQDGIKYLW